MMVFKEARVGFEGVFIVVDSLELFVFFDKSRF